MAVDRDRIIREAVVRITPISGDRVQVRASWSSNYSWLVTVDASNSAAGWAAAITKAINELCDGIEEEYTKLVLAQAPIMVDGSEN